MFIKTTIVVLVVALCAFYKAAAKPSSTLGLPSEANRDPDRPVTLPGSAPCQEGKTWKNDCNTCVCNNGQAACTLKACLGHSVHRRQVGVQTLPASAPCQEGKTWKDDCNTCVCTNGQAACTLKACLSHSVHKRQVGVQTLPASASCQEGKTWKDDCNSCVCTNGQAACTLRACVGGSHKH